MIVLQSRRQIIRALLGSIPLSILLWRSSVVTGAPSDASDVVIVDGWVLLRDDLRKARIDAT
jgi:hypothetical protein